MEMASAPISRGEDEIDIELQVHCLETKAYSAVLRAFNAESDALSWEKAELISHIRKGLRISSAEHKEILRKISSDELVKSIRITSEQDGLAACNILHAAGPPKVVITSMQIADKLLLIGSHQKIKVLDNSSARYDKVV
ncbi:protein EMSY-LIKE 3-like isoform X1 [Ananas comosus]|uniref:Protein EMSY-LIKE 3-like isoform X1 n=1 Tax=Ananas comosus TaxID=4615 RepID=A0A6P5F0D7_ANACO|nr:protein EMSY-LIKE 3-like isoform X1 [Ananas comosus]XP_020089281.1 protein EMSY-LIKE 3-like isoform X1 [Ananas comosus]XP_020089283.1 protein EMSY-LIKE 3-like isoform X1 [Ananas comosus]XP_020089284.1 protein EMSY-LIKE 3-like isoform X1 [Ananas comosus]